MTESIKQFYKTHNHRTLFIIASFILFWPLAIYLMWKHKKWSVKARTIITASLAGLVLLFGLVGYNAPPYINLSNGLATNNYTTDNDSVVISGEVSTLHNAELQVNGKAVTLNERGNFTYTLPVKEGDTEVTIVAKSKNGIDTKRIKVHRTTSLEFAERKIVAEREVAEKKRLTEERAAKAKEEKIKAMPVCNGTSVSANCVAEGIVYKKYVYHAAIPEKTHTETVTTYQEKITGYCTLCVDGTYSPSCATGRGACSHHGGVAEWNAPRVSRVPVYDTKTVVDAPAQAEYYEKVVE